MVFPPRPRNQIYRTNHYQPMRSHVQSSLPSFNQVRETGNVIDRFNQAKPALTEIASKGIGGMSKTLTNIQQVLKVVETTAPLVQQYGPLVKNLPMMLKMLKAFNEADDVDASELADDPISIEQEGEVAKAPSKENLNHLNSEVSTSEMPEPLSQGQSTPKLFI